MKNTFKKILILSLFLILQPSKISEIDSNFLIIWDVGQGQWVTLYENGTCTHFDMGGEYAPLNDILNLCQNMINKVYISHADMDHIRYYKKYSQMVAKICLINLPYKFLQKSKISSYKICSKGSKNIKAIYRPRQKNLEKLNSLSSVYLIHNFFLNPGDSTKEKENYWKNKPWLASTQVLLLGHHGSLTSTSVELLNKLPRLKWTLVSARKKKYGHPHGLIYIRLQNNKTPIISTNDWGSIWIKI